MPHDYEATAVDKARSIVAVALADNGCIEEAVRMANQIKPESAHEKSRTYADIGRVIRARRLAHA
jgi:hypothetical protein